MLYSQSKQGFLDAVINKDGIPSDAIEITTAQYTQLLTDQSAGAKIQADAKGFPVAVFPPAPTFADVKANKLADLAAKRFAVETAGTTVGGSIIKTDRESQAQLNSALTALQGGMIPDTPWKAANGWAVVTLAQIQPIAQAVATRVRACFAQEKVHSDAINALTTIDAIKAYDITTGWPV